MEEQPECCSRCDFGPVDLVWYETAGPSGAWLCDLCASTHSASRNYEISSVVTSMCYIGNAIIRAIREKQ